jgi:hypothetical protein
MCVRLPVRERKMGGNLGMKEELGGWVAGEDKQGIVEKVEFGYLIKNMRERQLMDGLWWGGWASVFCNTRLPFLCLINVKGKTVKCTSSFLLFPFFLIIFFCDTFITYS